MVEPLVFLEVMIGPIIFLVVGIVAFLGSFILIRQKRLIKGIPTSKIRSLAMGLVEIYGIVIPSKKKILKSPLTKRDCVYYKYKIEEYVHTKKRSYWETIKRGTDFVHFFLKDKTGSVLVEPKGATIDIPPSYSFKTSAFQGPPIVIRRFLEKNRIGYLNILGTNRTMRYSEYIIPPKQKLYIMGTAGDNPYVEEATAMKSMEDIMIQKGKHEKFYYISNKHEKAVLKSLKYKIYISLFGGIAAIIGSLIVIFNFFG